MRLYEIKINKDTGMEELVNTGETFKDMEAFKTAVRKNGAKYLNRKFRLLSQCSENMILQVDKTESFILSIHEKG